MCLGACCTVEYRNCVSKLPCVQIGGECQIIGVKFPTLVRLSIHFVHGLVTGFTIIIIVNKKGKKISSTKTKQNIVGETKETVFFFPFFFFYNTSFHIRLLGGGGCLQVTKLDLISSSLNIFFSLKKLNTRAN